MYCHTLIHLGVIGIYILLLSYSYKFSSDSCRYIVNCHTLPHSLNSLNSLNSKSGAVFVRQVSIDCLQIVYRLSIDCHTLISFPVIGIIANCHTLIVSSNSCIYIVNCHTLISFRQIGVCACECILLRESAPVGWRGDRYHEHASVIALQKGLKPI